MKVPQIKGYDIKGLIGEGASGSVFAARKKDGPLCAVKVFESMSSNPGLVESRMLRVVAGGAREVTVPILARALENRPACVVMPFYGKETAPEDYEPDNLQTRLPDFLEKNEAWKLLESIGRQLAVLHGVRVAHGNLKPGNIFFSEQNEPLLSDYAEGLMPGVHHLAYSDALLYAPPEQLRDPVGYAEEAGYRWDVFAFGVLSYRLLTRKFPRCDELFQQVSPKPGHCERILIEAEHQGIAKGLEEADDPAWPKKTKSEREKRLRKILTACLSLDPRDRPADLREVMDHFTRIDADLKREAEEAEMLKRLRKTAGGRRRGRLAATFLALTTLALAALWFHTENRRQTQLADAATEFETYRTDTRSQIDSANSAETKARASEEKSLAQSEELANRLRQEKALAADQLQSLALTTDLLFKWVLERGEPEIPTLAGRKGRLLQLQAELEKQLAGFADRPVLAAEKTRLRFRLAEVLLAAGEDEKGRTELEAALAEAPDLVSPAETALARLRVALIHSEQKSSDLPEHLESAEAASATAWNPGSPEALRAEAVLALVHARHLARKAETDPALAAYQRSLGAFQKLSDLFPENLALRRSLAQGYAENATAAEGLGSLDNAAILRGQAAQEYLELAEKTGKPEPEGVYQKASATAARALAQWSKGDVFEADRLAKSAITLLLAARAKLPDDFRILTDLASQQGIIATSLRDEGRTEEAEKLLRDSITTLQTGLAEEKTNWKARYLLSSLKWQLSSLMGQMKKEEEEVRYGVEAHDDLQLIYEAKPTFPRPEEVEKSLAYLCGDLGTAALKNGQTDRAIDFFKESRLYWNDLLKRRGETPEYREGLAWITENLARLGVK